MPRMKTDSLEDKKGKPKGLQCCFCKDPIEVGSGVVSLSATHVGYRFDSDSDQTFRMGPVDDGNIRYLAHAECREGAPARWIDDKDWAPV